MDLFEERWQTYRTVVDHDLMEHHAITSACAATLQSWFTDHPDRPGHARLLDLGCGDLAQMAPIFGGLPLGGYVGVDLTEPVLSLARTALGPVPFAVEFHHRDVRAFIDTSHENFDLVHASFVLHHLEDEDKTEFLAALRQRIEPDGLFLWTDVFRIPGESREEYLARYCARIKTEWDAISADARDTIAGHIKEFDFPTDRDHAAHAAQRTGWQLTWLWQGRYQAEAVALLRPDPR